MDRKLKILHIAEAFGGGIFTVLTDLINETCDDFEIYVAYSLRDQTPENFKDYFDSRVNFIEVKSFGRSINPLGDTKAFFEIKRLVKQIEPDIVHLHSSKAGFIGRFAVNCKKTKVLYNPHSYAFLMQDSSALKRRMYWAIEKSATINNATTVGCSYGEYKEALKLGKNAICINNGINIELMQKLTKELEPHIYNYKRPVVCTSARISAQKQPAMFNRIAEYLPELDFRWIGDGELADELTAKNISKTGWLEKQDVIKKINDCDIFVLTSAWEGLPISLLEAMYMGKICIVTDCIGNRDVIKNGENGFVCKNAEEFRDTIKKILKMTPAQADIISANARTDVIENYNMKKNVKQLYTAEYLKAMNGR